MAAATIATVMAATMVISLRIKGWLPEGDGDEEKRSPKFRSGERMPGAVLRVMQ